MMMIMYQVRADPAPLRGHAGQPGGAAAAPRVPGDGPRGGRRAGREPPAPGLHLRPPGERQVRRYTESLK